VVDDGRRNQQYYHPTKRPLNKHNTSTLSLFVCFTLPPCCVCMYVCLSLTVTAYPCTFNLLYTHNDEHEERERGGGHEREVERHKISLHPPPTRSIAMALNSLLLPYSHTNPSLLSTPPHPTPLSLSLNPQGSKGYPSTPFDHGSLHPFIMVQFNYGTIE
jgi:hypothetical protein